MALFDNNGFSQDSLALRLARLLMLKTYINAWAVFQSIPQALIDWALVAYDEWKALLGASTVEQGEAEEAYQDMHEADEITFSYYIRAKGLLKYQYGQDDKNLKFYGITGAFPKARKSRIKAVQDLLDGHARLHAQGDPNVLPDTFIIKLQGYLTTSDNAYANLVGKEKPEADQAIDNQNFRFGEDTKKLGNLLNWVLMTWNEYESFLSQLGFAPRIPKPGGGQPYKPINFIHQWHEPDLTLTWDPCENTTSYQLAYTEDDEIWEELYAGTDTTYTYAPPVGTRTYKVRARNANGYSDWSDPVEFEVPG